METSIFLARVMGLFGAIATLAIMVRYRKQVLIEMGFVQSESATVLSGFVSLLLGVLLVVSHNVWTSDWRVVITILAWATLLKGVLRILWPEGVKMIIEKKMNSPRFIWAEAVVFLISVFLLYKGFFV